MAISATIFLRGVALTVPFVLHLALVDFFISLLLPVSFVSSKASYNLSSQLAASVWRHIQYIFESWNGAKIIHSSGGIIEEVAASQQLPNLPATRSAIIVSNHVAWSDFYLLQSVALATKPQMLPFSRYFAKRSLRYVPLLGWGLWAMRMPLVSRKWTNDRKEIERVFRGPRERGEPIWLVMFCEGTRFTKRKWEQGVAWARSKGKPEPSEHVLAPRSKGFIASVEGLRDGGVSSVVDITLAYATKKRTSANNKAQWVFMSAPDMWTTLSRPDLSKNYAFWVHSERFAIDALPRGEDELAQWLEDRWKVKGERLSQLGKQLNSGAEASDLRL